MEKTGTTKKMLSMLLAFIFVLSAFSAAGVKSAEAAEKESEIMPCFNTILSATYAITIDGIRAHVSGILLSDYATNLQISLELQKYKKADGWYTVKMWAGSAYGKHTNLEGSATINIFCDYRLRAIFKADKETCTRIMYPD